MKKFGLMLCALCSFRASGMEPLPNTLGTEPFSSQVFETYVKEWSEYIHT
jgi:hypothetical protein